MGMPEGIVKPQFSPSTIPPNGVFISSNAKIHILAGDNYYEVVRAESAVVRWSNNTGLFLEMGKQHGITYVGNFDVSGSFNRPFLNFAQARMVIGSTDPNASLEGILAGDNSDGDFNSDGDIIGSWDLSRYPQKDLIVETVIDEEGLSFGPLRVRVHKPLFSNASITFDASGLIRSGAMDYIGSYITLEKDFPALDVVDDSGSGVSGSG